MHAGGGELTMKYTMAKIMPATAITAATMPPMMTPGLVPVDVEFEFEFEPALVAAAAALVRDAWSEVVTVTWTSASDV